MKKSIVIDGLLIPTILGSCIGVALIVADTTLWQVITLTVIAVVYAEIRIARELKNRRSQ